MDAGAAADTLADTGTPLTEREAAYRAYRREVLRARAAVAVTHVALVGRAARGGAVIRETRRTYRNEAGELVTEEEVERARPEWKASQWLLATSFREDFGQDRRRLEVTGADGGPLQHEHASPAGDALSRIADRLDEVAGRQAEQLPGGWDRLALEPAERLDVEDAELVEDGRGDGAE